MAMTLRNRNGLRDQGEEREGPPLAGERTGKGKPRPSEERGWNALGL